MQCACTILSSVVCPALQKFSALSQKRHDLNKKKILNIKFVVLSSLHPQRNISFLEMIEMLSKLYIGLRINCLLFLADITET